MADIFTPSDFFAVPRGQQVSWPAPEHGAFAPPAEPYLDARDRFHDLLMKPGEIVEIQPKRRLPRLRRWIARQLVEISRQLAEAGRKPWRRR